MNPRIDRMYDELNRLIAMEKTAMRSQKAKLQNDIVTLTRRIDAEEEKYSKATDRRIHTPANPAFKSED